MKERNVIDVVFVPVYDLQTHSQANSCISVFVRSLHCEPCSAECSPSLARKWAVRCVGLYD